MSARDAILGVVRANRPAGTHELPPVPRFGSGDGEDKVARFRTWLERMGGRMVEPGPADDPLQPLRNTLAAAKVVCSTVREWTGNRNVADVRCPKELADVDVAVVRAAFGVAESGSVLLVDDALGVNALVYLAQHLVVLLDPTEIVATMHDAYRRPDFASAHYASFHTGPSATADIEGVLIHGAQGVRSLTVLLISTR